MSFLNSNEFMRQGLLLTSFFIGALLAAFSNYLADCLGWEVRFRSPWKRRSLPSGSPFRPMKLEFLPIIGWLITARTSFLARKQSKGTNAKESVPYGCESSFFWARPFLTEILFAALIACRWIFWRDSLANGWILIWGIETFFLCVVLGASLVDLDDCIIPDVFTIPSAVVGLIWAAVFPAYVLFFPTYWPVSLQEPSEITSFTTAIATSLGQKVSPCSSAGIIWLAIGFTFFLWSAWNFALLDRRFYLRLGVRRAFAIFFRRIKRSGLTPIIAGVWGVGTLLLLAFGHGVQGAGTVLSVANLDSLATSFFGLFVGVVLIWLVRLLAGFVLGMEAMGFGDVILGGVIGCFIGWQGVVVVFFVAPFLALVYGGFRRCFNTTKEIPYGPFLSLGCVIYLLYNSFFNEYFAPLFNDLVFAAFLGVCGFVLLVVLLGLLVAFKFFLAKRSERLEQDSIGE